MRISYKWLRELVELDAKTGPKEVADALTMLGLEVEGVEDLSESLSGLVVARVVGSEAHPDAEKLSLVDVELGDRIERVVCGAKNFSVGDLVAYAGLGVTLPDGLTIKEATIRGVTSRGMLCSEKELGLSQDHAGILILSPGDDVGVGMPLATALGKDDVVLEIGVTPNRPDALSHIGVAREVSVALGARQRFKVPTCAERGAPIDTFAQVTILDHEGCPRYGCRVIEDVKVGPSPRWLKSRLEACGVRSINNVVDVTNLVLMERGLPLHGFDLDKIAVERDRPAVIIRSADDGEKIVTLDEQERELTREDLVIADISGPIAVAGIMGGATTEVGTGTTRVLLEGAFFSSSRVRRTARRLGIHSEASHRFERGCDPNGVRQALDRAASLIAELAGGRVARGFIDVYPRKIESATVNLRPKRAAQLMGLSPKELDEGRCSKLLIGLGLEVAGREGDALRIRIPTYRPDLTREVDLIEELLRVIGYDSVPATLPARGGESGTVFNRKRHSVVGRVRRALFSAGFAEAVNLAFVSPTDDVAFSTASGETGIEVKNPLGEEMSRLRRSLLPGLVTNVALNQRRGNDRVALFETATVFKGPSVAGKVPSPTGAGPAGADSWAHERQHVAAILLGEVGVSGIDVKPRASDFFDLKGTLEEVFESLGVNVEMGLGRLRLSPFSEGHGYLHPSARARVEVDLGGDGVVEVGVIGELHPDLVERFELRSAAFAFELDADALAKVTPERTRARALPRFPAVRRDLALVLDENIAAGELCRVLAGLPDVAPLLENVDVFDVYQGEHVPTGKKSVALSFVLRAPDRTLTEGEIGRISDALIATASAAFAAEVRT